MNMNSKKASVQTPPRTRQVAVLRWQYPGRTTQARVFRSTTAARLRAERYKRDGAMTAIYVAGIQEWRTYEDAKKAVVPLIERVA